jgi:hypothetical protein
MIAVRSDALGTRDDRGKDFATFCIELCVFLSRRGFEGNVSARTAKIATGTDLKCSFTLRILDFLQNTVYVAIDHLAVASFEGQLNI